MDDVRGDLKAATYAARVMRMDRGVGREASPVAAGVTA